ncbi:metacaspase-like protein, putative [Plasmodium gallinaceum]|uniref:Metacaspase-like protein, putative n=1 Tax=Plasmodium gallinaceum TaxID=5849 RepID=A0A1J1GTQ8_PLAGA|nr:metacaspase-like protein, putative [Plasmodium gallinaceum]CRG95681.1 metacaspase-like protein, putative [Plasmodium gallinaceum]
MAYNDNISLKNEETNEEIYMYCNKNNTLLNNFSNLKKCQTKNFNIGKYLEEDKLKLNEKNIFRKKYNNKITNNIKCTRDEDYNKDRSQSISRNDENKYNIKKFVNLKTQESITNGIITSRFLNRSNTPKRSRNIVETNVKKNNLKIGIINEYRNSDGKNIKMDNKYNNASNNLLYTYMNNEDIYENKNIHDNHILNSDITTIKNSVNNAFKNKNTEIKSNVLIDLNKVRNFKCNNSLDNNISNKNDYDDKLNISNTYKCDSSKIIVGNVNNNITNNSSTENMFNKFNEILINGYPPYYSKDNIGFPKKNIKISSCNNFLYNDNILMNEKNCENNNYHLYNNITSSYNLNNNKSEQTKIIYSDLYIETNENKKNELKLHKANTDGLNMKQKLKCSNYCNHSLHNSTINKIEFLEENMKNNKYINKNYLNSQKKCCTNKNFFNSNIDNNKYASPLYYKEDVDLPNHFYTDNILEEKITNMNKNNLENTQDTTINKKENFLNYKRNAQYNTNSEEYKLLKVYNNSIYNDMNDYLNNSRNKREVITRMDNINKFCEYNNCENKKDIKNYNIESTLYNEKDFMNINDVKNNINDNKEKIHYITIDSNKNNCLNEEIIKNNSSINEQNNNYYINVKMNDKTFIASYDNTSNKCKQADIFKNENNKKYFIDSSHVLLNENISNDNVICINSLLNKEINNNNYLKISSKLDEKSNNITKKINTDNNSDKIFDEKNLERNHTSSSVSTYLSLNSNKVIKVNNDKISKWNKNANSINLKNMNEVNYEKEDELKHKIINKIIDDDNKYNESNNYMFSEDTYFPPENAVKGSLNSCLRDNYYSYVKILKEEKLLDNNKKFHILLHQNNATNNFIMNNENKENANSLNMNTINIPLHRDNSTHDIFNKKFLLNKNIITTTNILNNKIINNSNISHTYSINKSLQNNNKKLSNTCILNSTVSNGANSLNKNNIPETTNNFLSNNLSNKDSFNSMYMLNRKMMNNNTLCNNNKITLKTLKNENKNYLSKTVLLNLNRINSNNERKGLESCKSFDNSKICNYLRNIDTKSLTKFHRTASLRNHNLRKKKLDTEMHEHINNFKEENFEIDTKYIVKKAVVIGCNYVNEEETRLYGCANDAYVFCRALVKYFDFAPENILLLTDSLPSNAYIYDDFDINRMKYIKEANNSSIDDGKDVKRNIFKLFNKSGMYNQNKKNVEINLCNSCKNFDIKNVDISSQNINLNLWPTRINILKAVNWLVRDSVPFGSYVFYFAGKSVQVDNMSGWEGEGYDEAFLCSDPFNKNYEHNVITAVQLKDLLLSINSNSQMTIILDCSGGQTILDPAGTENSWSYIKGCKQKGIWPITNPTDKVHKAVYDITILNNSTMKKYFCKSRFSELIEVESTAAMIDPLLQSISSLPIAPKAYCLCAATWEQISIEGLFPIIEFARVKQLKKTNNYDNDNKNKSTKKKREKKKNSQKILSNEEGLKKKKSFYEKNFNFSLSMMRKFFNNNKNDSMENKNVKKFEEKDKSKKLYSDNSYNDLKDSIYSGSDNNSDMSVNTDDSEENTGEDKDDNYILVSHGVFTYCFIEAIMEFKEKELKNNIFEKNNQKFLPMTLKNLINLIQEKIQYVKNNKLKKLNQKPEFTIHPGANATINNYFVHYSKNIHFQNNKYNFINSDLYPFLNVNKAWEEINKNTLRNRKSLSLNSTLINTASSKYFTEQNDQIKNSYNLKY